MVQSTQTHRPWERISQIKKTPFPLYLSLSLHRLTSHSPSDTQALYSIYDIISLPARRQAAGTGQCQQWALNYSHAHIRRKHYICGTYIRQWVSFMQTHTEMLAHLHLHEGSPVKAACCSRQGTPQTTPLRHDGTHFLSSAFSLLLLLVFCVPLFCLAALPGAANLNPSPLTKPVPPTASLLACLTAPQHSLTTTKTQATS